MPLTYAKTTSAVIVRNLKRQCNNLHCAELKHFTFKSRNYVKPFTLSSIPPTKVLS